MAFKPCGRLFPGDPELIGNEMYYTLKKAARNCGITKRVHPHLFRHMRALELRRQGAEEDAVLNSMGWKTAQQYNLRYGRRASTETLAEISYTKQPDMSNVPPIAIKNGPSPQDTKHELVQLYRDGLLSKDEFMKLYGGELEEQRKELKKEPEQECQRSYT